MNINSFFRRTLSALTGCVLGAGVMLLSLSAVPLSVTAATDCVIDTGTTYQTIRGFGGMNHPEWVGDLTAAQRETAFGNGTNQLGMTVCRIFVNSDSSQWSRALATAKDAQARGQRFLHRRGIRRIRCVKTSRKTAPPEPISGKLIQNLVVNDRANAADWSIVSGFKSGDAVYGDSDITADSVPANLANAEMIRTACDSKMFTSDLGSFTAGADMTVYVAADTRVNANLTWLQSWTKTGSAVTTSNDVTLELFFKAVKAGETVTLGTNGGSEASANYLVFALTAADYYLLGDVNGDRIINGADMSLAKRIALGNIPWVFDPAVLVDDDGTGYLYFGGGVPEINGVKQSANPKSARVVKLGADMASLAGDPQLIDAPYIFEDSGINKIDGKYYYSYCSNWSTGGNPYGMNAAAIEYMVSDRHGIYPNSLRFQAIYRHARQLYCWYGHCGVCSSRCACECRIVMAEYLEANGRKHPHLERCDTRIIPHECQRR